MLKQFVLATILTGTCFAQPPLSQEAATISGVVTSTSGEFLRRTTLRLTPLPVDRAVSPDAPPTELRAETDANGAFTFIRVVPGRYMLFAERMGFLPTRFSSGRSQVLTIASGQELTGVVIKMVPQGIIAGHVVNDENEPFPNATVTVEMIPGGLQERRSTPGGVVVVMPKVTGITNADGAFAIGNLSPGRYVVSVSAPAESSAASAPQTDHRIYVPTYYPDATDILASAPIELGPGTQARGLEMRLQRVQVFGVSGKVLRPATDGAGSVDVINLIRRGTGPIGLSARSTGVGGDGEFSFDAVAPGTYILEAKASAENERGSSFIARQIISVGSGDIEHLVMEMKPALELSGKVVVEDAFAGSWPSVALTPVEGLNFPDLVVVDASGQFTVAGLEPASYHLTVGSIPAPLFIKSIRLNGQEVNNDLDFTSIAKPVLEIVLSRGTASVSGVVRDSEGPVGRGIVVMANRIPHGPARTTMTDENGHFSFTGLASGECLFLAIDGGPTPLLRPDVFEKLATPIRLRDGPATADLRLTEVDALRAAAIQ